jgi:hypothetical protein
LKNLPSLTPGELRERENDPMATGNKAAFLRAACGIVTREEGAVFRNSSTMPASESMDTIPYLKICAKSVLIRG